MRLEVEQAYIAVVEADERIGATEKAIESARENLRLAQGRYDAGVGTILELTEAQLSLSNAEADYVRALTDYRSGSPSSTASPAARRAAPAGRTAPRPAPSKVVCGRGGVRQWES